MRIYEGMFVLDDSRCSENPQAVAHEVRGILEKNRAQVFTLEKWDERRLAYPIHGHSRGVYLLVRFTAPADAIVSIERDCQLNDTVLRVLIARDTPSEKLHKAGILKLTPEEGGDPSKAWEQLKAQRPAPEQAPAAPAQAPQAQGSSEGKADKDTVPDEA